jgi:hypothetical protein
MWQAIRFFVNHPFAVWRAGSSPLQLAKRELLHLAGRDIQPPYLHGVGFSDQRQDDHLSWTTGSGFSNQRIVLQKMDPVRTIVACHIGVARGIQLQQLASTRPGEVVPGRLFSRDRSQLPIDFVIQDGGELPT